MTYAEKFLLYVAQYVAIFMTNRGTQERVDVLMEAQKTTITSMDYSADEVALLFVLWKVGHGPRPRMSREEPLLPTVPAPKSKKMSVKP